MTGKANFTDDEWALVLEGPPSAGMIVLTAQRGGTIDRVNEFAYLLGRLQSVQEGDGTLLDRTCCLFIHEHAEANQHKDSGLAALIAGHAGGLKTGMHTRMRGTIGDLYLTLADEVFRSPLEKGFPTGSTKLSDLV